MDPRKLLGVDIGGTGIKMAAVEIARGPRILARDVLLEFGDRSPERVLGEVADHLAGLVKTAGWSTAEGVGVGSAGLVRPDPGDIVFSPNLPQWADTPIKDILSRRMGLPVRVDNDGNTFALAEWRWGAGQMQPNVVFLTLGTGIGGAMIADGRLIRGSRGFAGEPGHATLVLDGIPCPCGNHGCAERYVGSRAIVEAARAHPDFGRDPQLGSMALSPEAIAEAARQGSAVAREVFRNAGVALGGLLVTLVNIFNPDSVVVGGGVAQAGDLILDPAREHLVRCSLVARQASPPVIPAGLGEPAGVLGAAALFLNDEGIPERP